MSDKFSIKLTGKMKDVEVHPDTMDMADLLELLDSLIKAVKAECPQRQKPNASTRNLLTLNSIEDACSNYVIGHSPEAELAVRNITEAFVESDFNRLNPLARQELYKSINRLINAGVGVQVNNGRPSPVFSLDNPLPVQPEAETLQEETSLLAKIIKVGGESKPTIQAHFYSTEQNITVDCKKDTAKRLSDSGCLYEDVSLEGVVTWQTKPWQIIKFDVSDFILHDTGNASKIFGELSDTLYPSWDGINSKEYVDKIRGGDN